MSGPKTPKEVMSFVKDQKVEMVDFKFVDMPGTWQHFAIPIGEMSEDLFEEGLGFDGSSIRGFQPINASDMLVVPDAKTAVIDPFMKYKTMSLICNIVDPISKETYSRDPRFIAQKAENYLKSTGVGDVAYFGPEAEFFIFDDVQFVESPNHAFFKVDSQEGIWNSGKEEGPNLGNKVGYKRGYFPVAPTDQLVDIRAEMVIELERVGIKVERDHHEVATAGQCEIDIRFDSLTNMADKLMWFKYVIKNVARRHNKVVTFMPKPMYGDNGSGMHTHQSIWREGKPLFAGDDYAGLSKMALHYTAGIMKHAPTLAAFTNPTTNSYKRLVPGFEAPVNLAYSSRNRSAAIRIPMYSASPKAKRIEVRFPDPSCNGYLAFAAMLLAGLDGVQKKLDAGEPMDKDIYGLSPEELKNIPSAPGSLEESLRNLGKDHEFLLKGDVFPKDLIEAWIEYKTEAELNPVRLRPTPMEYQLYFDC